MFVEEMDALFEVLAAFQLSAAAFLFNRKAMSLR